MAIDETSSAPTSESPLSCTVTFGRSSFVGRSLVSALLKSPRWNVRIADPLPPPDPSSDPLLFDSIRSGGASYFQVDLRDGSQVRPAVAGSVAVFHVDPPAVPSPPSQADFYRLYMVTVQGAKNLIAACRASGVRRLVYTSSADVVFDGVHGIDGGYESLPYPDRFTNVSNELMAQVEILVLNANGRDGLSTCVLRPSNPFGPGDSSFVPFLVEAARSGFAKFIVGSGKNMCDFTFVENVAHANICAEQALCLESTSIAGKPLFITNHQPVMLWDFICNILEGLGYQSRPRIHLPVKLVLFAVVLAKKVCEKLGFCRMSRPLLTPAIIYILSCTRTFNCSEAKKLIGYSPIISLEDGVTLTLESFSQLARESAYSRKQDFTTPSKAEKLLGSGAVANILLWRDERKTFAYILSSYLLFYWFLLSGRTFISSTAKILWLVAVILFVHGFLPSSMFGFNVERMPSSYFQVSESTVRQSFITLASLWNKLIYELKLLAQGDDWNIFFKVAGFLYVVKLLLPFSLSVLIGVGLTCLFSLFIVYEQCEEEVDKLVSTAYAGIKILKETVIANLPSFLVTYICNS